MKRSRHPRRFLTAREREQISAAIAAAERETSGEIRVHLAARCPGDPYVEATRVFQMLGMQKTRHRNGVLIYLATADRRFAIVGDEGIHRRVPESFWDDVAAEMARRFRESDFCDGICTAVRMVGEHLAAYFPPLPGDVNELPDVVSTDEGRPGKDGRRKA